MVEGVRARLIDVAERIGATRGITAMTVRDVQVESGQSNKSVIQYYFGSRTGLLEAIMAARMAPINERRGAILEALGPTPSLGDLVRAMVLPLAEATVMSDRSYWARFLHQATVDPAVSEILESLYEASAYRQMHSLLLDRLRDLAPPVRRRRADQMVHFVLMSLAEVEAEREQEVLDSTATEGVIGDLVVVATAMLNARPTWSPESADAACNFASADSRGSG